MRKWSFILLGLLFSIYGVTYYLVEGPDNLFQDKRADLKGVLTEKNIQVIKLPNVTLTRKSDGQFYTDKSDYPVDQVMLEQFFRSISLLKVTRKFSKEEVEKFDQKAVFGINPVEIEFDLGTHKFKYIFGSLLGFNESFYAKIIDSGKSDIVVVKNEDKFLGVHSSMKDLAIKKYSKLVTLLTLREPYFFDRDLLGPHRLNANKLSIRIDNKFNEPFELLIEQEKTAPPALNGLKYESTAFARLINAIANFRAKKVFPVMQKELLKEKVADIELVDHQKKKIELQIYRKYGGLNGYFATSTYRESLYELAGKSTRVLLSNVQDYWEKKIPSTIGELGENEEPFKMSFMEKNGEQKEFNLLIPRNSGFEVKEAGEVASNTKRILNQDAFKELFALLVGEGVFARAFRVSPNMPVIAKSKKGLHLQIGNLQFNLFKNFDTLVVEDIQYKMYLHFLMGEKAAEILSWKHYFNQAKMIQ